VSYTKTPIHTLHSKPSSKLRYNFVELFILCRSNHSTGVKENEDEIFRTVDRDYRRELRITRSKYGKVVEYINEIYRALANYDVRFDFDPVSVDDHRCEVVSSSELKLTCELKHISKRTCEVHGDTANGRIQIKLRDDVRSHHRYDRL
jgi:hypothetical protein